MSRALPIMGSTWAEGCAFHVMWTALVSRWRDPFATDCAASDGGGHRRVTFTVHLVPAGRDSAVIEAWLDLGGTRRTILAETSVRCEMTEGRALRHLDVYQYASRGDDAEDRLLALSLNRQDESIFAQSALLRRVGLNGGGFDPPRTILQPAPERVHAEPA